MAMTATAAPADEPNQPRQNNQALVTKEAKAFGVQSVERSAELAAIAVAAGAKAEVNAAYEMALMSPRHEETARTSIIDACRNPRFAEKARYKKPVGKKEVRPGQWEQQYVIGPSIRFAETALRYWKNVLVQQVSLYDDQIRRIVRITTKDVESNITFSKEINLEKTVERQNGRDREILGERVNSYGKQVFIVRTTEDELNIKEAALASKVIRTNGLRLVGQHIIDEAMDVVEATLKDKAAKDPAGERRQILDGFAKKGITPIELERYMSKPSAQFSVDDLVNLRDMLTSIEDGHTTWQEYLEGTSAQTTEEIAGKSQPETKGAEVNEKLKDLAKERGVEQPAPSETHQKKANTAKEEKPAEQQPAPIATPTKALEPIEPKDTQAAPAQQETAQQPATHSAPVQSTEPQAFKEHLDAVESTLTNKPAEPAQPPVQDLETLKNSIATLEFGLKTTEAGKKKYQAVLSVMKVRLTGKQQPLDVLPDEQLPFYLANLKKAKDSITK